MSLERVEIFVHGSPRRTEMTVAHSNVARHCFDTIDRSAVSFFFFFQAEDGIRDKLVTGVQTCALPIYVPEVALRQVDACAVDEDVDAAVALEDRGGDLRHLGLVGDVHRERLALAGRLELLLGGRQRFLAAPRDDDVRAGARELDRAGEADARAAAGDPGNLTGDHTERYRRGLPPAPC